MIYSQARNIDLGNKIISKDIDIDTLKTKLEDAAVEAQKEVNRTSELKGFENEKTLLAMHTLESKMEATVNECQKEASRTVEQKDFEKERALLQQEKVFNKKMQEFQQESNKKIEKWY